MSWLTSKHPAVFSLFNKWCFSVNWILLIESALHMLIKPSSIKTGRPLEQHSQARSCNKILLDLSAEAHVSDKYRDTPGRVSQHDVIQILIPGPRQMKLMSSQLSHS